MYNICFSLSDFSLYDGFCGHPYLYKWPNFISFYGWVTSHCIYVPHLLYPLICHWTFRYLHVLAIVNSAAVNTGVRASVWRLVSLRYKSSSGIAGSLGFPGGAVVKNLHGNARDMRDVGLIHGLERSLEVGNGSLPPVLLPEKFHGQRSLAGCSLWSHKESDMTEWLSTHMVVICLVWPSVL